MKTTTAMMTLASTGVGLRPERLASWMALAGEGKPNQGESLCGKGHL